MLKLELLVIVSMFCVVNGARILGIVPTPAYSHQVTFQPLWRELSLRGHQVTTLTTDPINDPRLVNLTEIDLSVSHNHINDSVLNIIQTTRTNLLHAFHDSATFLLSNMDRQLQHHQVQSLIKDEDAVFDLVIIEYLLPTMVAFAQKFNCPHIGMLSSDALGAVFELIVGNPTHPVLYPEFILPFSKNLSLSERLISVIYSMGLKIYMEMYVSTIQQSLVDKHFGPDYPSIKAMSKNLSLLFINSDTIFHPVRPLVPAVIQIGGGSHRTASKPLPKDLQKVLDDATSGVIYFSLGSLVKGKDLPVVVRNQILAAFSELPFTILWKFESDEFANKPGNVFTAKWFPQQDILKHPKIKLFITQGGLQSMDEAIYDHVPMLGMPFFWDQAYNVKRMEEKGFGLSLDFNTLEKEHFKETILELINNPKYRNKIKELAKLASDQPMTGLEKAVWWTEYVLRHKGAKHLRSPALDIPLYQYLLLDVTGVIITAFFICHILIKSILECTRLCYLLFKQKVKKH